MEITLKIDGPLLPGSISTANNTCGKSACGCLSDEEKRHGTYYRWTGTINGKRTTKTIDKKTAEECLKRIKNYRALEKKIKKLIDNAIKTAPWNEI